MVLYTSSMATITVSQSTVNQIPHLFQWSIQITAGTGIGVNLFVFKRNKTQLSGDTYERVATPLDLSTISVGSPASGSSLYLAAATFIASTDETVLTKRFNEIMLSLQLLLTQLDALTES